MHLPIHPASMTRRTASALGATLRASAVPSPEIAARMAYNLAAREPNTVVIVADDLSVWTWPIQPGVRDR